MTAEDRLLDHMEQQLPESDGKFRVTDASSADWAVRKAQKARLEYSEVEWLAKHQIDQIRAWQSEEHTKLANEWEYFEGQAVAWHQERVNREVESGVEDKHLTKTVSLPSGAKLTRRARQPDIDVDKDADLPDWLTRVKRSPDVAAIRKHVKATGEVPDGVTWTEREPSFSVQYPKDGDAA